MSETFDIELDRIIRAVASGNKRAVVHLARLLRSDRPLSPADRETLALLVEGRVLPKPRRGRPARAKVFPPEQRAAAVEYLRRTDAGEPSEAVANEIFTRLNVRRSTFFAWVSGVRRVVNQLDEMGLNGLVVMESN